MKDYKVLVANGTSVLSAQVVLHLNKGFVLQGGVSVTSYEVEEDTEDGGFEVKTKFQYTQAVVKDGE